MKNKNNIIIIGIILIIIAFIYIITNKNNNYGLIPITHEEIITKQENKEDFMLIISRSDCSHCMTYKPKVQKLSEEHKLTTYYIDLDTIKEKEQFMKDFNLKGSTPVTLFFKGGKEISILNRIEGDLPTSKVVEKLQELNFID